jgi:hypothetical protein
MESEAKLQAGAFILACTLKTYIQPTGSEKDRWQFLWSAVYTHQDTLGMQERCAVVWREGAWTVTDPAEFETPGFEAGGLRASHGKRKPCRPVSASLASTRIGQWDDAMQPGRVERHLATQETDAEDEPGRRENKKELQATWPEDAGACCRSFQSRTPVLCRSPTLRNPCQRRGRFFFSSPRRGRVLVGSDCTDRYQISAHMPSGKLSFDFVDPMFG